MPIRHHETRNFGLIVGAFLCVLAGLLWLVLDVVAAWSIIFGAIVAVCAVLWPSILIPVHRLFEWLGRRVARINNYIILGTAFYLAVTPFALVLRILRRDAMARRHNKNLETYFVPVRRTMNSDTMRDYF